MSLCKICILFSLETTNVACSPRCLRKESIWFEPILSWYFPTKSWKSQRK